MRILVTARKPAAMSVALVLALATPAAGHRLGADCNVRGDRVEVEAFYSDDTAAREARVSVRDNAEKVVAEGRTDDKGKWSFPRPGAGLYRVTVDAGPGHRATIRLVVPDRKDEAARVATAATFIARIKAVKNEGEGGDAAATAWRALIQSGPDALMPLLNALDDAAPSPSHWLCAAFEQVAEQALAGRKLPPKEMETFAADTRHGGRARFLAYDWLVKVDPAARDRLLPGMLDDPGLELRREAVAAVVRRSQEELGRGEPKKAIASLRAALTAARDGDQVRSIAGLLEKVGVTVDLAAHLGFIRQWQLLGPFDNPDGKGFATVFPPEKEIDLAAASTGKNGMPIRWKAYRSTDAGGVVDLNVALGKDKEVIAYALARVVSDRQQPVEVRAGSNNAVEIFLNGQKILSRAYGRQGMRTDQHVGRGTLKVGPNEVLIKVSQDANVRASQQWSFQLRLCDKLGGAVPVTVTDPDAILAPGGNQR